MRIQNKEIIFDKCNFYNTISIQKMDVDLNILKNNAMMENVVTKPVKKDIKGSANGS